ncbi:xylulose kinase [Paenibacillus darwinianus]|uniref:Xylulose kinase n=1 Tax=Paenibacillus darwinianus TaxID=1380763 RepID=A0A9W5S2T9_9BACL|nr:xylulokinase [Paenibacillus darwinianus]EXX91650.1 xylulose kinase [Paenibacillus darwinianus]EXX91793.1 xylulose kinase [Paenibacillus darwinianus]EXX92405.1 xylulose kinase [Paenibacillus darwinianus]
MSLLMGIDLGTSSVKALLMDVHGKTYGIAQQHYDIDVPRKDWAEQSPERWWTATADTIRKLFAETGANPNRVTGLGLSGQMHGLVTLDAQGTPVRPAIIWSDQRSKKQVARINDMLERMNLTGETMNKASTGFALSSLLWIKENEPEHYAAIRSIVLPKDYIRYKLTGRIACEATDASSSLAFNTRGRQWLYPLIEALGIAAALFPECREPFEIAGEITADAAWETGLRTGTSVVYGGADQCMQAVGNGVVEPGRIISNIGTGGQVAAMVADPVYDPQWRMNSFCHIHPGSWAIQGSNLNSGLALKWLKDNVLQAADFNGLMEMCAQVEAGSEGVLFLPYLIGERTPHMDADARAGFLGMTLRHRTEHLVKAVLEGVVYALRDSLELMEEQGIRAGQVIASGGGAKHRLWLQCQADIFGKPVYTTKVQEEACVGAAIVAGTGVGEYRSVREGCGQVVALDERYYEPDPRNQELYDHYHGLFKQIYLRNRELFKNWTVNA